MKHPHTLSLHTVCHTLLFLLFGIFSWRRASFFYMHIENFSLDERLRVGTILGAFLIVYALTALWCVRARSRSRLSTIICAVMPLVFIALITPPLLSRDTVLYAAKAKNFVRYHLNPYAVSPIDPLWRQELHDFWWMHFPSSYGPLFHLITLPFGASPFSLIQTITLYKILMAGAFLASIWMFDRLRTIYGAPAYLTILYAFNPALIIHGVLEGHNDLLVAMALMGALILLRKPAQSALAFGAAVALKYVPLILLPIYWIENARITWRRGAVALIGACAVFIISTVPFAMPLGGIRTGLTMQAQLDCLYQCTPYVQFTARVFGENARMVRLVSFALLYAWLIYYFLFKHYRPIHFTVWSLGALMFVYATWVTPWYPLTLLPFTLVLGDNWLYLGASALLTAYALLGFFHL